MTTLEIKGEFNITRGRLDANRTRLTNYNIQLLEGKQAELLSRMQRRTCESQEAAENATKESCGSCCN